MTIACISGAELSAYANRVVIVAATSYLDGDSRNTLFRSPRLPARFIQRVAIVYEFVKYPGP